MSFILAIVHVGLVKMFLQTSKTSVILCSVTSVSMGMGKCCIFKGQSFERGVSCIFQAIGNTLLQRVQSQHN